MPRRLRLGISAAIVLAVWPVAAEPLAISWEDLIPRSAVLGDRANVLQGIIDHAQVAPGDNPFGVGPEPPTIEQLMGISSPVEYRTDLDGAEVTLLGYVLPLTFDGTEITDFLLVPFIGACVHVPPPPPNQLVLVTIEEGYAVSGLWEPVEVTGTLSVSGASTDLAEVGYAITATQVEKI